MEPPGRVLIPINFLLLIFTLLQDQIHCLDLKRIFNIDSLPVGFASQLPVQPQDGSTDHSPLNQAINMLVEVIWRKGGFRFWHRRMKQEKFMCILVLRMAIALTLRWRQDSATHDEWSGFRVTATLHSNRHSKIVHWQSPCDTLTMRRTWTGHFPERY
ncbi:hypothetical protein POJ06DRAFT_1461 [Lipomyces tetrasporus]|uniref:Uncharacterized protein n=1 Tax=Lipomyces tetrasporus TaxID=54092 RepID=A0AAD7QXW5_9ASCO|nr:uncharacterized protein POJ06DRAFT_1461 [Lipomyces tetrasporus]KAJ8103467.1 hypothetical protein POJ06DRAFT_1461 [Lipomyces tetrasporus]